MKLNSVVSCAIIASSALSSGFVQANDLFLFTDNSNRLPSDPDRDSKDTLDVELADIDSDGDLDLFLIEGSASGTGFQNRLWINDGGGNFTDETDQRMPTLANNSIEIDLADVDGDNDLDAVVSNLGPTELLINDGSGVFTARVVSAVTQPGPPGFAVPFPPFFTKISAEAIFVDVDGDGDQDILISNENPFPGGQPGDVNELLINDGNGNFSDESSRLPIVVDNTSGMAAGDVDSDGDIDLVIGNLGQNTVYVNDGTGRFSDETSARFPTLIDSTRKVVLGDMDGDGDLDLVAGNSRNQQTRLYLNDGSGAFTDATDGNLPRDSATTTDIDVLDLNGDGWLDIFVTNVGDFVSNHGFLGEPNRLYLNKGNGSFVDATFPRLTMRDGRSTNAEFGDVDGDGVADLVVGNSGGVNQPDLPPPDGAERLFIRHDCNLNTVFCHQSMLDGLKTEIADLSTARFPDGDMSSRSKRLNRYRKGALTFKSAFAQGALNGGKETAYGRLVGHVVQRADGDQYPRDWVIGGAADRINGYGRFSLDVLFGFGL